MRIYYSILNLYKVGTIRILQSNKNGVIHAVAMFSCIAWAQHPW